LVPDEYQCCPGEPTVPGACQGLPEEPGELGAPAPPATRYYYDQAEMRCKEFIYNGRKGNQNNFLTLQDCEQTCNVFVNPCNQPIPLPPQMCSAGGPDTCGPNAWCHVGATPETTLCCPSEGDPCSLPLNRGTGNQFMDRWYFNPQSGSCQPFTYAGLHGNQNNFLTREACEQRCGPNPCFEGRPFVGVDGRPQTCSISANLNTCPANYWCHIGADMTTTVCCPGASTNICNLPMSTGDGNYNLERFYFDQSSKTCRPFIYNGLKGNQNNFITLVTTNACSVPLAPGTGNSGLSRWYYNPDDRQCLPFQYNGKRGNQNNFESQAECERTCPEDPCDSSWTEGEGEDSSERYYYNPVEGDCYPFKYKGRKGNENNFLTKKMCQEKCKPIATVCFGGELPLESPSGRVVQCHTQPCPDSHYCHLGKDVKSTVCCEKKGSPCDQQLMLGVGDTSLPRFYYDIIEDDCLPFNYTGIGGNENNFPTRAQCLITCPGYRGYCPHGKPHIVGGVMTQCGIDTSCPVNHLNSAFWSEIQGRVRGTSLDTATIQLPMCAGSSQELCLLSIDRGACGGRQTRYAFNRQTSQCVPFDYTGCGGNLNNFVSMMDCMATCGNVGFRR
ncbi:Kunitz/Bovine pancreatic trypsin inhibitor domain protein, partial [Ancylostoma ceylanicum]